MNNILIIITGWIVLLSIAVYIVTLFIKEFVAMVRSEATLYKRTKLFRTRYAYLIGCVAENIYEYKKYWED